MHFCVFEHTILNAYIEVLNQLTNIKNLESSYDLKSKQVDALTDYISISSNLFKTVLVNIYKSLGGGWQTADDAEMSPN